MFKFIKKLFTKEQEEKRPMSVVMDSDIKKEIIQKFDKGSISTEELFDITQDAKAILKYDDLTVEQKFVVEQYQDYILYIARPLRAYELEEDK